MGNEIFELRENVQKFIRLFGLLKQTTTPCGYSISLSQVFALQELENKVLSVRELAMALNLEPSSVSRLIDVLVKHGFVHRELNESNRREVKLSLTTKGETSLQRVKEQSLIFYETILSEATDNDKHLISDGFKKITKLLEKAKNEQGNLFRREVKP